MDDISLKYGLLDKSAKAEIMKYIDVLLEKKRTSKRKPVSAYKKKILKVSKWSEDDLKVFDDVQKRMHAWTPESW